MEQAFLTGLGMGIGFFVPTVVVVWVLVVVRGKPQGVA